MTWTALWWYWLLEVGLSWFVLEIGSIIWGKLTGQQNIFSWTLSDTIRRWSSATRWLAPVVIGTCAGLMFHFFGQANGAELACKPDQSGRMTICCPDELSKLPCDWHKYYCVCANAPIGYGY